MRRPKTPNLFWLKNKQILCTALATMGLLLGFNYGVVAQNVSYNANSVPIGGYYSSAFGFEALKSNTGRSNTANGYRALYSNTTGGYNTASGVEALYTNDIGEHNTAMGVNALWSNKDGGFNTATGGWALCANTSGNYNTAMGHSALRYNTIGILNTATGSNALFFNLSGNYNTASGHLSLASNTKGSYNTTLGSYADVAKGDLTNATAIGANAKVSESNAIQLGDNAVTKVYAGVGKTATIITGGLQVTGGSPAVGQVLTSDASGIATWQAPNTGTDWHLLGNYDANETSFIGPQNLVSFNIKIKDNIAGKLDPTYFNTFYGYLAGQKTQPYYSNGTNNTAVGYSSLATNTYGTQNTTLGYKADVGTENLTNATALGANAKVTTSNAVQLGDNAVTKVYAGVDNAATVIAGGLQITGGTPAIGKVLTSDATGTASWQTPIPSWSLTGNTGTVDGVNFVGTIDNIPFNIRVNNQKAARIDHLKFNTFYGYQSGNANTTGGNNTVVGHKALSINTAGLNNTAVGFEALLSNATGAGNTALGQSADVGAGNLTNATALGAKAKVTESNAIQLGDNAVTKVYAGVGKTATVITGGLQVTGGTPAVGKVLTSDANGIASWQTPTVGWGLTGNAGTVDGTNFMGTTDNVPLTLKVNNQKAGRIDHKLFNTSYGYQSANSTTTGSANTVTGYQALYANTTGWYNTANGYTALYYTTGNHNTGSGYRALKNNAEGSGNTAMGSDALLTNNTGSFNTAHGHQALYSNTMGGFNTAHGYQALYANITGDGNTAVGRETMKQNDAGDNNTAIGSLALSSNTNGDFNTALGYNADVSAPNLNNTTAVGSAAIVNTSNKIRLGSAAVTEVETQFAYTTVSDGRFKTDINEQEVKGLAFIKKLRPVVYNFDTKKFQQFLVHNMPADAQKTYMDRDFSASTAIRQSGFIAQEVEKAAQEVGYGFSGVHKPENANDNYSLAYSQFVVPLVKAVQEQQQIIEQQQKINDQLQQQLNNQQQRLEVLEKMVTAHNNITDPTTKTLPEPAVGEGIILFPNPTTGMVTVKANDIDNGIIEMVDMQGNSVQKSTFSNAKLGYQLNVSGYAKGVYILNIIANNKKYTKRLVIQ